MTNLTPEEIAHGEKFARLYDRAQEAVKNLRDHGFPRTYTPEEQERGRDYLEQAQDLLADAWAPDFEEENED